MPDPHDEDKIEAEDLRRLIEQSENEESRWADRQQALEFLKQDLTVVIPIEPSAENEELRCGLGAALPADAGGRGAQADRFRRNVRVFIDREENQSYPRLFSAKLRASVHAVEPRHRDIDDFAPRLQ
jgi:hypothetical protein